MPLGSILGSSLSANSSYLLVPSTPSFIALSSDHCLLFWSCFCHHLADFSIHKDEPPTTLASQSLNLSFMTCVSSFQPLTLMVVSLPQSLSPRSQLKASHSLTTISCLSSKSALGFPCLPLFLFSSWVTSPAVSLQPSTLHTSTPSCACCSYHGPSKCHILAASYSSKIQYKHHFLQEAFQDLPRLAMHIAFLCPQHVGHLSTNAYHTEYIE